MTNPVTDQSWPDMYKSSGSHKPFPVAAGISLKQHSLKMLNSSGYVVEADAANGAGTGAKLLGPALDQVDNTDGDDGDKFVVCDIGGAEVKLVNNVNIDESNVGDSVVINKNRGCLSSGAAANNIGGGSITEVISGTAYGSVECWVKLKPFTNQP